MKSLNKARLEEMLEIYKAAAEPYRKMKRSLMSPEGNMWDYDGQDGRPDAIALEMDFYMKADELAEAVEEVLLDEDGKQSH